ncbi:MAG: 50S ribosomal protein L21 [Hyphomicrobiales bacterium]
MYAVIKTGGKQYKVAENDVITVERLHGEPGQTVNLDRIVMVAGSGDPIIGAPYVAGASVGAEVVEQGRGNKIAVFKKKRRKGYRRLRGHRQLSTTLRIIALPMVAGKTGKVDATAEKAPVQAENAEVSVSPPAAKSSAREASAAEIDGTVS